MPRRITPLSDTQLRTIKPKPNGIKLFVRGRVVSVGHAYRRQTLAAQVSFWG